MSGFVGEGTPLTAQGSVDGTDQATYELPLLGRFVVESVVASIDASGGGDTTPTLTVLDKSGAVIARKSQTSKIPAGDTGDATWALRLADDGSSGAVAVPPVHFLVEMNWGGSAGYYAPISNDDGTVSIEDLYIDLAAGSANLMLSSTYAAIAGGALRVQIFNDDAVAHSALVEWGTVQQIGAVTREVALGFAAIPLPPHATTPLPFPGTTTPNHLIDHTTTPATFIGPGVYAVTAQFAVSL